MDSYPTSTSRFLIDCDGSQIEASEVLGLSIEIETIQYREGASRDNLSIVIPGMGKTKTIHLKRGIKKGNKDYLNWFNTIRYGTLERRNFTISLLDQNHEPVIRWLVKNAFPIKIEWSDLKSNENEPAIETLEIVHEGIEVTLED